MKSLLAAAALLMLAAPPATACNELTSLLGSSDALDKKMLDGTTIGGLSALAQDADGYALALVDNQSGAAARFYDLRLHSPANGLDVAATAVTTLQGFTGSNFDGEGLVIEPDGSLLASSETEPSIRHFSRAGAGLGTLAVPARFKPTGAGGQATANQTLEGLTRTPGGSLVAAMEAPLTSDPNTASGRRRIRFLVYPPDASSGFGAPRQVSYEAEAGQGVSDVLALDDSTLLVLERTLDSSTGFAIRVFVANLGGASDVTDVEGLDDPTVVPAPKRLLVDLGQCPGAVLDNVEGMTLGTPLADGRQRLYLVSDDNFSANQHTRIYDLAFRLTAPAPTPPPAAPAASTAYPESETTTAAPAPAAAPSELSPTAPTPSPRRSTVLRIADTGGVERRRRRLTLARVTNVSRTRRTVTIRLTLGGHPFGPVRRVLAPGASVTVTVSIPPSVGRRLRHGRTVVGTQTASSAGATTQRRSVRVRVR